MAVNPYSKTAIQKALDMTPVTPPSGTVVIRPGHFVDLFRQSNPVVDNTPPTGLVQQSTVVSELNTYMALRGARTDLYWRMVEGATAGSYNFTWLGNNIKTICDTGKLYMLFFRVIATTGPSDPVDIYPVPDYVIDGNGGATYNNGMYPTTPLVAGGRRWNIRLENANVRTRIKAMWTALIAYLKTHTDTAGNLTWPKLEAITLSEAIIGTALSGWTTPGTNAYFDGYLDICNHIRSLAPDKVVAVSFNHPIGVKSGAQGPGMSLQMPKLPGLKLGLFTPNVVPDDPNLWRLETASVYKGSLRYFKEDFTGILAKGPNVQGADFRWTAIDGTYPGGHVPTINELYTTARIDMGAHYIIWMRELDTSDLDPAKRCWDLVLEFINTAGPQKAINGGLGLDGYPSVYL